MAGREDGHRHRGAHGCALRGIELLADLAPRTGAVLGLDDDAQRPSPPHSCGSTVSRKSPFLRADDVALRRARALDGIARAADGHRRASPRAGPRSPCPWPTTSARSAPRAADAASMAVSRSLSFSKPWPTSRPELVQRRAEARRVEQLRQARRVAIEVACRAASACGRWRCRACPRRTARDTKRFSWPRSPRNCSSVRGSRPSVSREVRAQDLVQLGSRRAR